MGNVARFTLAGYLALVAATILIGGTTIPLWVSGLAALVAAVAIVVGR